MEILMDKIVYAVLGGLSLVLVTAVWTRLRAHMTGRDALVKYSTFIKRHAKNRREIENLIYDSKNLNSIIMQGVDAVYVALAGKDPSVAVLYLRNKDDARLFRECLDHLDKPETVYALATRQVREAGSESPDCAECIEIRNDAPCAARSRSTRD